jgi:Fic family protein
MSVPTFIDQSSSSLPQLVDHAAAALTSARTAAEVLEAKDVASFAYDTAKRAARLAKAKSAHDELISAAHRAQADALAIESQAKRRLADEYDEARINGTASAQGQRTDLLPDEKKVATIADLGLTHKEIHEARLIRDAEQADPGIVRRTLDDKLERGEEPTRAALRKMVVDAAMRGLRPQRKPSRRNPLHVPPTSQQAAWQHVTGTFRAFAEWATDENLALAHEGMREARAGPFHHLDVKAIAQGAECFIKIKEWFDA